MGAGTSSGTGKPSLAARRRRMSRTTSWRRRDSAVSAGGSSPSSRRRSRFSSTRISPSSRHGPHNPPHASREAVPPTVFGDLLHALGYLLGRSVWPQFCTHRSHARRQVHLGLAPAANAGPVNPPAWEMAFRTNGHAEGRGNGDGRLDTRLGRLRLRIRPTAELRMQQSVLINAPGREPSLLNKSFGNKRFYAALHMARSDVAARPNFRVRHFDRFPVVHLGGDGRKYQLRSRADIAAQHVLRHLSPAAYRGRGLGQFVPTLGTICPRSLIRL